MHSQLPCTHAPWAEQSLGHSAFSHASPLKPLAQMHVPLTHVPRKEQSSTHASCEHVGPTHGASQLHVPLEHTPWSEQPPGHVLVAQSCGGEWHEGARSAVWGGREAGRKAGTASAARRARRS